jgi:hypothetical protein
MPALPDMSQPEMSAQAALADRATKERLGIEGDSVRSAPGGVKSELTDAGAEAPCPPPSR